jgi:glucose/arabinose dehydrogenase
MLDRIRSRTIAVIAVVTLGGGGGADAQPDLPPGFVSEVVASGLLKPVAVAFSGDGRVFVAEQRGIVWVIEDGETLAPPFIDLRPEVNGQNDHGLLGLALDPQFLTNRHVYLLYSVDPVPGEPDEPYTAASFGRLVRYTGTAPSGGNVADPQSRLILLGQGASSGLPVCQNHTIGSVHFALDGSLLVAAGDGAHFELVDDGGVDPDCFGEGMHGADQDIGAFRAQYLGSLAGKILRLDPTTGAGLPSNPYWTGDGMTNRARVWVSGLRNPYRFAVRPGTAAPGTLLIADVGWAAFEEVNVAHGGENFGWPCYEGSLPAVGYPASSPKHSGCDTIGAAGNPGPLHGPTLHYHHANGALSSPPGFVGLAISGIAVYHGTEYPVKYHGACFVADYLGGPSAQGWIAAVRLDDNDQLVGAEPFATMVGRPVDLAVDPLGGDVHTVSLVTGEVRRLRFDPNLLADITGDGSVDVADLIQLIVGWGPCPPAPASCPADINGSGSVDPLDLQVLIFNWG